MFGPVQVIQGTLLVGGMFTAGLLAQLRGEQPPRPDADLPEDRSASCKATHPLPPHFGEAVPQEKQPWRPEMPQLPWVQQAEKRE